MNKLKQKRLLAQLNKLDSTGADPESAHCLEDKLLWHVVFYLMDGRVNDAIELANALHAHNKEHAEATRWYA